MNTRKLSDKQKAFIQEYIVDLNATKAAERAGYKGKNLNKVASELLSKEHIQIEIDKLKVERSEKTKITAELVLEELYKVATFDIGEVYCSERVRLKDLHEIPEETRKAIASIDIYEDMMDGVCVGETKKVRPYDKLRALELLGKHLVLFTDKVEHSTSDEMAERLKKARERAKAR